jgi:LacI family transcriptional regulator
VKRKPQAKPSGIKEIAERLGISIGTVDRALHDRTGVKAETRRKILRTAEELNYRPNVVARNLKLNRKLKIAVRLPEQIASFFDPLREGIRSVTREIQGIQIDLDFRTYPRLGEGDLALVEADLDEDYDGIILTPGNPRLFNPVLRKLSSQGTSVVCVASDAPNSGRLTSVCVDATVSGGIAAELLAMKLQAPAAVAVITGDLGTQDHTEKLRGFAGGLAVMAPHLQLLPAVETHESAGQAYRKTLALLARKPQPRGIYVNTANSLPVQRALEERGLLGSVQVVTTDLFPELIPLIESGKILATLHQRPFAQGKIALELLLRYMVDRVKPDDIRKLAPHIVMRSNLSLFSETLR